MQNGPWPTPSPPFAALTTQSRTEAAFIQLPFIRFTFQNRFLRLELQLASQH